MGTPYTVHSEIAARFSELKPALTPQAASVEANRCLNCFDAPCTAACPTHIDVPRFIKRIATGNLVGSARGILEANVLAGSCARVCPVEVLCEGSCVMHGLQEEPIMIGRLQRHAMDDFQSRGLAIPMRDRPELPFRVACIGAGPASLACAAELRQWGIQVTVFDRRELPGGLNTYGVAEYKLSVNDSLREVAAIAALGVQFVREDITAESMTSMEQEFDVIFLGVGLGAMHRLPFLVSGAQVMDALDLIAGYKTGAITHMEGSLAVIGCGNTAIDAAVAAKRLGAEDVAIVYRRGPEEMSAFDFEYQHALSEGVRFIWWRQPIGFANGAITLARTYVDDSETLQTAEVAGELRVDHIVPAIGQAPLAAWLRSVKGVEFFRGRISMNRATGETSHSKFFAGGDCANGGREVVDAVADGKRAARGIVAALEVGAPEVTHG